MDSLRLAIFFSLLLNIIFCVFFSVKSNPDINYTLPRATSLHTDFRATSIRPDSVFVETLMRGFHIPMRADGKLIIREEATALILDIGLSVNAPVSAVFKSSLPSFCYSNFFVDLAERASDLASLWLRTKSVRTLTNNLFAISGQFASCAGTRTVPFSLERGASCTRHYPSTWTK